MRKRNDATPPQDVHGLVRIFPFVMRRRCDSLVYHKLSLDLSKSIQFVKKINKENSSELDHKLRVFELLLSAINRLLAERPKLNRFISNFETWQRNELSYNFIIKEDYTDEAPEHTAIIKLEPDATLFEVSNKVNSEIERARTPGFDNETDVLVDKYLKMPKWIVNLIAKYFIHLDKKGRMPAFVRDMDGLHVSAFIANLGSIGLQSSPLHHLYEWGTTSLFFTLGKLNRTRLMTSEDTTVLKDTMDIGITIDERIADGMYIIRSLHYLQKILDNPEQLLEKPTDLPKVPRNHKEYKRMLKEQKKLKKKNKK